MPLPELRPNEAPQTSFLTSFDQQNETNTEVLFALTKLLERKEALLSALRTLNDRAEATMTKWEQMHPGTGRPAFHPNFQSQYAWVAHNIDITNRALRPAVQQLQYMVEAHDLNSSRRTMDIKPSANTKRQLDLLWQEKFEAAKQFLESLAQQDSTEDSVSSVELTDSDVGTCLVPVSLANDSKLLLFEIFVLLPAAGQMHRRVKHFEALCRRAARRH